ncbi:NAD(P)H-hydrate dehydratase [Clostridium kluyveri]|uniref:NAD(P)H-hydrate dehydratase n=1 Tax=Clostridium kluyveri TaxID=1534 RepID=UPI00224556A1|nr:NAD(P)H-hydrate dehydratase [Clostridium kluyveri]UZQ48796.1 NAD(P)H-hydrate dehydratase [Clostridium kluyveri]
MKIATVRISRDIDNYAINQFKIPGIVLMENAAIKVIKNIDLTNCNSFCVICTRGNNGGDGFAVARHLYNLNKKVQVFLVGKEEGMSEDCKVNYTILKNLGLNIYKLNSQEEIDTLKKCIQKSDVTIDALFGTGISREIVGIQSSVISLINENSKYIISIDVPSGLNGDTGKVLGNCVRADVTVTFQLYKKGFLTYGSHEFTGKILVEDIGIPEAVVEKFSLNYFIIDRDFIKKILKERNKFSHKGDYGRVFIIAGSMGFTGAAYICTEGAIKSGAGLVTLGCYEDVRSILSSKLIEGMTVDLNETTNLEKTIEKSDVIAIGPGMGTNKNTLNLLEKIIKNFTKTVVIDADGINVLSGNPHILESKKCSVIITPHLGEMSRITGLDIEYIKENRIEVAKKFAKEKNVILLLKGYNTIVTDGNVVAVNSTGNSSMASGGMGDCLTGIIASFIAQRYSLFQAVCAAAFVHGYCGDKLSQSMFCVNASHILEELPFSIKELTE